MNVPLPATGAEGLSAAGGTATGARTMGAGAGVAGLAGTGFVTGSAVAAVPSAGAMTGGVRRAGLGVGTGAITGAVVSIGEPAAGLLPLDVVGGKLSVATSDIFSGVGADLRPMLKPKPKKAPQSTTRPKKMARIEPVLRVSSRSCRGLSSSSRR